MILRAAIAQTILVRRSVRVRAFAYLPGLCFPKEQDAEGNPRAVGLVAQNTSVICRADGVSVGIEAAWGQSVGLGDLM